MEDQVLADTDQPLVIASFQRERFYRQEAHRYQRIASKTSQVYVLSAPETEFKNSSGVYETIAFEPGDSLSQEWHLVVIGRHYSSCLICRERSAATDDNGGSAMDNSRRFEGVWTFERQATQKAAELLFEHILIYRPELAEKIAQAHHLYLQPETPTVQVQDSQPVILDATMSHADPFVQRLVTYLQAGQYKIIKANRSLASKEQKERLINSITSAIRRFLDPEDILQAAVQKLGEGLGVCRCIVYRCEATDTTATIKHEFKNSETSSLQGQLWPLKNNPLFQEVLEMRESLSIDNALSDPRLTESANLDPQWKSLQTLVKNSSILSWLLVPIFYQGRLLGMMELHHNDPSNSGWKSEDIALVDAIATQVGVALIQAEAYANLQELNEQLAALDRTRSNLVAITGHELRTPLSTIQVCLESLASEPDMSPELRQVMLNTALQDSERMRKLIQDFLTLSKLESGRIFWHPEALLLKECVDLAISHISARNLDTAIAPIENRVASNLPFVEADGEWLVEVLSKLLENACKFTPAEGQVTVEAKQHDSQSLLVTVSDTGRGIEASQLETVFDRFYQEEGALRRSAGGTGLGLAICRQIVSGWGGEIWAISPGKNQGSQFHFTIPIFAELAIQEVSDEDSPKRRRKLSKKRTI